MANFQPKNKYNISKEFSQPVQQDYDMFILISYKYLLHKSEKGNFFVGTKFWKLKKTHLEAPFDQDFLHTDRGSLHKLHTSKELKNKGFFFQESLMHFFPIGGAVVNK